MNENAQGVMFVAGIISAIAFALLMGADVNPWYSAGIAGIIWLVIVVAMAIYVTRGIK